MWWGTPLTLIFKQSLVRPFRNSQFAIRNSQNYKYKQIKKEKTEQTRHSFSISFPDFSHSF